MPTTPKAILIDIIPPHITPEESLARLNELESLLVTYGGFVIVRKIQKKQVPLGYIEAKDVGTNLDKAEKSEQMQQKDQEQYLVDNSQNN